MSGLLKITRMSLMVALAACSALWLAGCADDAKKGDKKDDKKATSGSKDDHKDHKDHKDGKDAHEEHAKVPHGGELQEVGNEAGHLEVIVPDADGKVVVYVLDEKLKELPIEVTELKLQFVPKAADAKEGAALPDFEDLTLKAADAKDGKASKFEGTHAKLKGVKAFTGVVDGLKIEGKTHKANIEVPSKHKH